MLATRLLKVTMGLATVLLLGGTGLFAASAMREAQPPRDQARASSSEPKQSTSKPNQKPEDRSEAAVDHYGDPLPEGAIARLGTVRFRHGFLVHSLTYSPDGKMIASGGAGRAVCVWDAATGRELRHFQPCWEISSVAFSPDSKTVAAAGLGVFIFDLATGKASRLQEGSALRVAFSPDGKTLASTGHDQIVHIWHVAEAKEIRKLEGHDGSVGSLAFSPDGKTLASGGQDASIRLWDPTSGAVLHELKGHKDWVSALEFSPDGKVLASGAYGAKEEKEAQVHLWDAATGKELRVIDNKFEGIRCVAFSPDSKLLAVCPLGHTLYLFDATSGKELRHWDNEDPIQSVCFSPDGKTLASGGWGTIHLWEAASGREVHPFEGHTSRVMHVSFTDHGDTLLSYDGERRLFEWNLSSGKNRSSALSRSSVVWPTMTEVSPDNKTLALANRNAGTVRLWDIAQDKEIRVLGEKLSEPLSVTFAPDGKLVAAGNDKGEVFVWDVNSGKERLRFQGQKNPITAIAFSSDAKTLALGSEEARGHPGLVLCDSSTGKEIAHHEGSDEFWCLTFSPDGRTVAFGGRKTVYLWDPARADGPRQLEGHKGWEVFRLAFSPDGKLLASAGGDKDDRVGLWEVATGKLIRWFVGHHSGVTSLAFSADGRILASGSSDSSILLWDVTGRRQNGKLKTANLTDKQVEAAWTELADDEPTTAHDALWKLVAEPEKAVTLLKERLRPTMAADAEQAAKLIADLDSDSFTVREKASAELHKLGFEAECALRKALDDKPNLEVRQRIEQMLASTTREAKAVLERMGKGK